MLGIETQSLQFETIVYLLNTLSYPKSLIYRSIQNICSQSSKIDLHVRKKSWGIWDIFSAPTNTAVRRLQQWILCNAAHGRAGIVSHFAISVFRGWYLMICMPSFRVSGWREVYELRGYRKQH